MKPRDEAGNEMIAVWTSLKHLDFGWIKVCRNFYRSKWSKIVLDYIDIIMLLKFELVSLMLLHVATYSMSWIFDLPHGFIYE